MKRILFFLALCALIIALYQHSDFPQRLLESQTAANIPNAGENKPEASAKAYQTQATESQAGEAQTARAKAADPEAAQAPLAEGTQTLSLANPQAEQANAQEPSLAEKAEPEQAPGLQADDNSANAQASAVMPQASAEKSQTDPQAAPTSPKDSVSASRESDAEASAQAQASEGPEESANPQVAENPAAQGNENDDGTSSGTVEKGETLGQLLDEGSGGSIAHFLGAARKVFALKSLREGQPYLLVCDPATGSLKRFEYEIDSQRKLIVEETGPKEARGRIEAIVYDTRLSRAEGKISDNLFQAVADIGESAQLALKLAELFASEINFIRDLQPGDSFSVLLEKRSRDGQEKGYGRVLAARFVNRGKAYEAFLYRGPDGHLAHYNRKGENLRKTLLQAPLAFTRLSSRFSMNRRHPILGESRPHLGVDYAAPKGTPVKAVGDGLISRRGWAGGYGNQVVIQHNAGLESLYGHLAGFARGISQGSRVRQGQVIGYVGSTGLSSGPHLDFRLRQGGRFVNPQKAINPRSAPIAKASMADFERKARQALDWLEGRRGLEDYDATAYLPEPQKISLEPEPEKKRKAERRRSSAKARERLNRKASENQEQAEERS